jgi:plasmid rolling circle replication initiator protein Rep
MFLRSRKKAKNLYTVVEHIVKVDADARFALLTLTLGRVPGNKLMATIKKFLKSWSRLMDFRGVEKIVKGYYRSLEITYDKEPFITREMFNNTKRNEYYVKNGLGIGDNNPSYRTYHVHIHAIIQVSKTYFNKLFRVENRLMECLNWSSMWQSALKIDTAPVVDIRAFNVKKGMSEPTKYVTKPSDIFAIGDMSHFAEVLGCMDSALHRVHLDSYGGTFFKARQELKLTDELGDAEEVEDDALAEFVVYAWDFLSKKYCKMYSCDLAGHEQEVAANKAMREYWDNLFFMAGVVRAKTYNEYLKGKKANKEEELKRKRESAEADEADRLELERELIAEQAKASELELERQFEEVKAAWGITDGVTNGTAVELSGWADERVDERTTERFKFEVNVEYEQQEMDDMHRLADKPKSDLPDPPRERDPRSMRANRKNQRWEAAKAAAKR